MSGRVFLLIDDSAVDRRIFRRHLERSGVAADLLEATNGREGISLAREKKPDAVILDFRLPDIDGLAVITELRAFYAGPIFFISGNPEASTMTNAFRAGAVTYLSKDLLNAETLGAAMKSVFPE